jgi:hypothetical protein
MLPSPSSSFHDQSATIRRLKRLVIALVLSNVGLGIFSFYLLRTTDRSYTQLISDSIPLMNALQTLTAESVDVMGTSMPALFDAPSADRTAIAQRSRVAFERERDTRVALLKNTLLTRLSAAHTELRATGERFTDTGVKVAALFGAGKTEEAKRLREQALRPAFDAYVDAATKAVDLLEAESLRVSNAITSKTGSFSTAVLGIGSWPIVLLVGLLLLTAVFVIVLMVLFRGREMGDTP